VKIVALNNLTISCSLWLACAVLAQAQPYTFTTPVGQTSISTTTDETGDGTNNNAHFRGPAGVVLDPAGNLYVADPNSIRRVSHVGTNWVVTTVAGTGWLHGGADGTNAGALFNSPQGIAIDAFNNLYVADTANNSIRMITLIGTNWVTTTIAGTSKAELEGTGSEDGTNANIGFYQPQGVALDSLGNLYVADTLNGTIRKIIHSGTNWISSTIAGSAPLNGFANGSNQIARFYNPTSLIADTNGNLFVCDFGNNAIREVSPNGTNWVVTTIAGLGTVSGSADGTNSDARFFWPQGIALDGAGNLYVTDSGNNTIRKLRHVGTNWVVTTLAGLAGATGTADGTGSAAQFDNPYGIAVDSSLNLLVADNFNFTIRRGTIAPLMQIAFPSHQVVLSWPSALTGYVAEASSSLAAGAWNPNTNGEVISGDYIIQTNSGQSGTMFFRLHKP
jgi:sugar lactone lactonase YvrE